MIQPSVLHLTSKYNVVNVQQGHSQKPQVMEMD